MSLTCHAIDNDWTSRSYTPSTTELKDDHTAENISTALMELMSKWGIIDKVVRSTTDDARNISNAMKLLIVFNMPCVGHTLQLSVLKLFDLHVVTKMLAKI